MSEETHQIGVQKNSQPDDQSSKEERSNEELDMYLQRSIDSYNRIQERMQKKVMTAFTFFLLSAVVSYEQVIEGALRIPFLQIQVSRSHAGLIFFSLGIVMVFLRALELAGSRLLQVKIFRLHQERYATTPSLWSLSAPGTVLLVNRFRHLGVIGKALRILLWAVLITPLGLAVKAQSDLFYKAPELSFTKILFSVSLIIWIVALVFEVFVLRPKLVLKWADKLDSIIF